MLSFADNLKTSAKLPNSVGFGKPDRRRNIRPPGTDGTDEADSNRSPSEARWWLIRDGDGEGGGGRRVNELRDQPLYQTIFAAPPRHERRCLRSTLLHQSRGSFVVVISFAVSVYVTAEGSEGVVGAVRDQATECLTLSFIVYLTQIYSRKIMGRAQEPQCESQGRGPPGLPVPNSPYGLCGRKVTIKRGVYSHRKF